MDEHKIVLDTMYGYYRLDPIPDDSEISEFYESQYYSLMGKGRRAPELRKLMVDGTEAEAERAWLSSSLYGDVIAMIEGQAVPRKLLDIGCGTGEFVSFACDSGWEAVGIEPSVQASEIGKNRDIDIACMNLADVVIKHPEYVGRFQAVTLLNVLEHVPDPFSVLILAKSLLTKRGMIVVSVPNEFNPLQLAARQYLGESRWWIAAPDHINYFDFKSLQALMEGVGYEVVDSQGTFPMEIFLLFGENYVSNSETGAACHAKRVCFEMNVRARDRRKLYRALVKVDMGRDCVMAGRLAK